MTTLSSSTAVPLPVPIESAGPTLTDAEVRARTNPGRTPLDKVNTGLAADDLDDQPLEVIGSTNIYDEAGRIRLIPVTTLPSPSPMMR